MVTQFWLGITRPHHGDNIKPHGVMCQTPTAGKPLGRAAQGGYFFIADGCLGRAEGFTGACADLDKNQIAFIECDQIQFATGATHPPSHDAHTQFALRIAGRHPFPGKAQGVFITRALRLDDPPEPIFKHIPPH